MSIARKLHGTGTTVQLFKMHKKWYIGFMNDVKIILLLIMVIIASSKAAIDLTLAGVPRDTKKYWKGSFGVKRLRKTALWNDLLQYINFFLLIFNLVVKFTINKRLESYPNTKIQVTWETASVGIGLYELQLTNGYLMYYLTKAIWIKIYSIFVLGIRCTLIKSFQSMRLTLFFLLITFFLLLDAFTQQCNHIGIYFFFKLLYKCDKHSYSHIKKKQTYFVYYDYFLSEAPSSGQKMFKKKRNIQ